MKESKIQLYPFLIDKIIEQKEVRIVQFDSGKEIRMEKRFLIRGYRENADFPSLCDEEIYSLDEALSKSREYFKKIRAINRIVLFEKEEGKKKAKRITLMNSVADPANIIDWWDNG